MVYGMLQQCIHSVSVRRILAARLGLLCDEHYVQNHIVNKDAMFVEVFLFAGATDQFRTFTFAVLLGHTLLPKRL